MIHIELNYEPPPGSIRAPELSDLERLLTTDLKPRLTRYATFYGGDIRWAPTGFQCASRDADFARVMFGSVMYEFVRVRALEHRAMVAKLKRHNRALIRSGAVPSEWGCTVGAPRDAVGTSAAFDGVPTFNNAADLERALQTDFKGRLARFALVHTEGVGWVLSGFQCESKSAEIAHVNFDPAPGGVEENRAMIAMLEAHNRALVRMVVPPAEWNCTEEPAVQETVVE